jgi:hypothetical protein
MDGGWILRIEKHQVMKLRMVGPSRGQVAIDPEKTSKASKADQPDSYLSYVALESEAPTSCRYCC